MPSSQSMERNTIATALGIAPEHTALGLLSFTLGGLSTISARGSSITIPIPAHAVRSDITDIFRDLPHIELRGDTTKVIARRAQVPLFEPLNELSLPPAPSQDAPQATSPGSGRSALRVSKTSKSTRPSDREARPTQAARLGTTRATMVADALGVPSWQFSNYPDVVCKLGDATKCEHRPTKNSRAAAFLYISVESQRDATTLLDSLGFMRVGSTGGGAWAAVRYEKVCLDTDTKSSASLALTLDGCDITISLGEPLIQSYDGNFYSPTGSIVAPEE